MKSKKFKDYVNDLKLAENILKKYNMLKSTNDFTKTEDAIYTASSPFIFRDYSSNNEMRNKNKYNFTFKLVDNSLIYFNLEFKSKKLNKGSVTYISGTFDKNDILDLEEGLPQDTVELCKISDENIELYQRSDTIDLNKNNEREFNPEYEDYVIKQYFEIHYKDKLSDNIIENILKINRNEIIIRMDIDLDNSTDDHPGIHLTINNIKNSRYKIENEFLISDFIYFILDLIYGNKCNRYLSYLKIN